MRSPLIAVVPQSRFPWLRAVRHLQRSPPVIGASVRSSIFANAVQTQVVDRLADRSQFLGLLIDGLRQFLYHRL